MSRALLVGCGTDGCKTARAAAADGGFPLLTIDQEDADICLSDTGGKEAPANMDESYFRAMFLHNSDMLAHLEGYDTAVVSLFVGGETAGNAALAFGQVAASQGISVSYVLAVPLRMFARQRSRFGPLMRSLALSVEGCRIFVIDFDTVRRETSAEEDIAPLLEEFAVLRKHVTAKVMELVGNDRFPVIFKERFYTVSYGSCASAAFSAEEALAFPLYKTSVEGRHVVVCPDSPLSDQERELLVRKVADATGSAPDIVEGTMEGSPGAFVFIPISFRISEGS
ncbi:MAG: hypothetical protein ACOX8X_05275 [Methanomethylophilus sp.]|jgi:hypothetical protein